MFGKQYRIDVHNLNDVALCQILFRDTELTAEKYNYEAIVSNDDTDHHFDDDNDDNNRGPHRMRVGLFMHFSLTKSLVLALFSLHFLLTSFLHEFFIFD